MRFISKAQYTTHTSNRSLWFWTLEATDDGHLSGFVNFFGNVRPDGFPVGNQFSIITDDPRATVVPDFSISRSGLCTLRPHRCRGTSTVAVHSFRTSTTVANVQAELDDRFARMAIEEAKKSTPGR